MSTPLLANPPGSEALAEVARGLQAIVGAEHVLLDHARRRTYECDGLSNYTVVPGLVVLPGNAEEIVAVVQACVAAQLPYVARGAGTGLSGGALPSPDGVLIVLTRLRAITEVDLESSRAVLEPGVANLAVTRAVAPFGLYYAPDPSSQSVCTIGGNVAENAGGAHCLKYGFTTNHVLGLEIVTGEGERVSLGSKAVESPGYDLVGAFIGSEGTLGIATEVTVRLSRRPESVCTVLAGFPSTDEAGEAVSAIIAAGVLPAAIELMDELAVAAVEVAVAPGYPPGAGGVLIVELDGPREEVEEQRETVEGLCRVHHAGEVRVARDDAERARLWKGRKAAFAAVGRISPDFIVQDGVIPRSSLGAVLRDIAVLAEEAGVRVANVFHAGDGNLHPLVLFDQRVAGQEEAAERVSGAIIDLCLSHGGSITGEHGVGVDKVSYLAKMYSAADLDTMQMLRCAFDAAHLSNPDKVFPTPRLCGEVPGRHHSARAAARADAGEVF